MYIAAYCPTMDAMREPPLPNFFVVGAGKAGTTSLYRYLRQHPQIYMSPVKEPCYFASEIRVENIAEHFHPNLRRQSRKLPALFGDGIPAKPMGWIVAEWEDYLRLFERVQHETAIGEASAAYLWSETAAERIFARLPGAKIIMILRDPAERAFSQYLHQLAAGLTRSTFREHIERCLKEGSGKLSVYRPLLDVGLYHQQVRRYIDRFPRKNIRVLWFEEAWLQPERLLSDLFEFLNVDPTFRPDISSRSLARQAPRFPALNHAVKRFDAVHQFSGLAPSWLRKFLFRPGAALKMDANDRQFLIDYYREDIGKLASMLSRDLSAWLK